MRRSIIYMYNRSILRGNDILLSMEKYGKLCSTIKELNFRSNYSAAEKFEDFKGVIRSRKLKKG
jgi:hypothetical protein